MRYLILCIAVLFAVATYAQGNTKDKTIIDQYAQPVPVLNEALQKNNLNTSSLLLIKVRSGYNAAFKKQFHSQIKRQINANWFIVDALTETMQKNNLVELLFIANNLWKYSPTLLYNQDLLQQNKTFIFLVEVNNSAAFLQFINSFKTETTIASTQQDANLY